MKRFLWRLIPALIFIFAFVVALKWLIVPDSPKITDVMLVWVILTRWVILIGSLPIALGFLCGIFEDNNHKSEDKKR
jgi:membrane protein YdbS with pleckstrin-like domain